MLVHKCGLCKTLFPPRLSTRVVFVVKPTLSWSTSVHILGVCKTVCLSIRVVFVTLANCLYIRVVFVKLTIILVNNCGVCKTDQCLSLRMVFVKLIV